MPRVRPKFKKGEVLIFRDRISIVRAPRDPKRCVLIDYNGTGREGLRFFTAVIQEGGCPTKKVVREDELSVPEETLSAL